MNDLHKAFHELYPHLRILSLKELSLGSSNTLYQVRVLPHPHLDFFPDEDLNQVCLRSESLNFIWKYSPLENSSLSDESAIYHRASGPLKQHLFDYIPCKNSWHMTQKGNSSKNHIEPSSVLLKYEEGFLSAWDLVMQGRLSLMEAFKVGIQILKVFHQDPQIWVHQDFHLGQFGCSQSGKWFIYDFEGLPFQLNSGVECQWMDIAGLIRSLDYAHSVLYESDFIHHCDYSQIKFFPQECSKGNGKFEEHAFSLDVIQKILIDHYTAKFGRLSHLVILWQMVIRRAKYEDEYERQERPQWRWIAQRGRRRELNHLSWIRSC